VNITQSHSNSIINLVPGGFENQAILALPITNLTNAINLGMNSKLSAGVAFVGYDKLSRYLPDANAFQKSVFVSKSSAHISIIYPDLTILAEPKSGYTVSYFVYLPNSANASSGGVCYHAYDATNTFSVTSAYYALYTGIVVYAGIPIIFVMMILLSIFARCCPWEMDREHIPLEIDTVTARISVSDAQKPMDPIPPLDISTKKFMNMITGNLPTSRLTIKNFFKMFTHAGLLQLGGRAAVFTRNYYLCTLTMFIVTGIIGVALLLPIDIIKGQYHVGASYGDFISVTIASLDTSSPLTLAHVIYVCVLPIIGIAFSFATTKLLLLVTVQKLHESYTIQVKGIETITLYVEKSGDGVPYITNGASVLLFQDRLKQQFNERFDNAEPVISVHVPIQFGRITPFLRRRRVLEQIITRKHDPTDPEQNSVTVDAMNKLTVVNNAIWKIYSERHSDETPLQTHSIAYVTFNSTKAAYMCASQLHEDPNFKASINWIYDDIMWDNLGSSPLVVRYLRKVLLGVHFILIAVLAMAILTFGILLSPAVISAIQSNPKDVNTAQQYSAGTLWATTYVPFAVMIVMSVFNEFIPVITVYLTRLETHMTKRALYTSTLVKAMGYMCVLTYLLPYVMHIFVAGTNPSFFFANQSTRMLTAILSQAIFSKVCCSVYYTYFKGCFLIYIAVRIIASYIIARKRNEMYIQRPLYDMEGAYARSCLVIGFLFLYSTLVPRKLQCITF
jgi:hypothetical protein